MTDFKIAPSILSANFACLGKEVEDVIEAGADFIHFDVMDNHYVPNLTFGPVICQSLRDFGIKAPIDVHLMVEPVDELVDSFAQAGATFISFHPEASNDVSKTINRIQKTGCKPGLAINPSTSIRISCDTCFFVVGAMPTPSLERLYTTAFPPSNLPSFNCLTISNSALSTRFIAEVNTLSGAR